MCIPYRASLLGLSIPELKYKITPHFQHVSVQKEFENFLNRYYPPTTTSTAPVEQTLAEKIVAKRHKGNKTSDDEVERYLAEPPIGMKMNPLDWWKGNEARFPRIAAVARDFLAIQATSVPSAQLFSKAGDVVTKKRNRLAPDTVQSILSIQSWLRNGFLLPTSRETEYNKQPTGDASSSH
jgi:hypothetical protein